MYPDDAVEQRCFSGSIRADHSEYLISIQGKAHQLNRSERSKVFADLSAFKNRRIQLQMNLSLFLTLMVPTMPLGTIQNDSDDNCPNHYQIILDEFCAEHFDNRVKKEAPTIGPRKFPYLPRGS